MHAQIRWVSNQLNKVDIKLLIFLVLLLNVKLLVKVLAIVLIYALKPDFKFGFSIKNSRITLLFPFLILLALINAVTFNLFEKPGYWLVFVTGSGFWIACLLVSHQARLFAEENRDKVFHTLQVFFILNALVSLAVLVGIMWETGSINPYTYQGDFQKYFIGTGDYIKGISFDTSTANAAINAFGVFLFLEKKKWSMLLLCLGCLLLTGSNLVNFLLLICLLFLFIFRSGREQKSIIILCMLPMIIFWARVSPQNNNYITSAYKKVLNPDQPGQPKEKEIPIIERPDTLLTAEQKKEKIVTIYLDSVRKELSSRLKQGDGLASTAFIAAEEKPLVPVANIHTPQYQHKDDTNETRKEWMQFAVQKGINREEIIQNKWPGKIVALAQTADYLKKNPAHLITGAGMGNFSSRLAFKASALDIAGYYPSGHAYIHPAFQENHLALYLSFFTKKEGLHSVINTPHSVFAQMAGEYGLAGLAGFFVFYIMFFAKRHRELSYGLPLLLFMTGMFFTEYWFEQLSIVFLFELLMNLNQNESGKHA